MTSISAFEFFVQLRDWWEKKKTSVQNMFTLVGEATFTSITSLFSLLPARLLA